MAQDLSKIAKATQTLDLLIESQDQLIALMKSLENKIKDICHSLVPTSKLPPEFLEKRLDILASFLEQHDQYAFYLKQMTQTINDVKKQCLSFMQSQKNNCSSVFRVQSKPIAPHQEISSPGLTR